MIDTTNIVIYATNIVKHASIIKYINVILHIIIKYSITGAFFAFLINLLAFVATSIPPVNRFLLVCENNN